MRGFHNQLPLLTRSNDGRHFIVEEHLYYTDMHGNKFRTETFLTTDGGSIPRLDFIGCIVMGVAAFFSRWSCWFWLLLGAGALVAMAGLYLTPYGRWWWCYIFHDGLFQGKVEYWNPIIGRWVKFKPDEAKSNELLFEAMEFQRGPMILICTVWFMLNLFGWRAFDEDRQHETKL